MVLLSDRLMQLVLEMLGLKHQLLLQLPDCAWHLLWLACICIQSG